MAYSARTLILGGLGAAIVVGLGYVSLRTDPVPVDLAQVTRGALEVTINADGRTRIRNTFDVSAPIAGTALRSPVDVGDPVVKGETVVAIVRPASSALLDARSRMQAEATLQEAEAARHVAQAELQQAQETLTFARAQFDRTQALVTRGVSSVTRLEDASQNLAIAQATVEAAQARIDMAQGTIERAQANLVPPDATAAADEGCCVQITAPADGLVLSIDTISERPVLAGASLLSIGDPTDLELVADILSTDGVRLSPGATAYVDRWGGDQPLLARLDRIDPKARTKVSALGIEEQRVDAYFTLVSPPQDRATLGDEFAVFLRIVEWQADDVLQIPLSAIFRDQDGWAVFVADGSLAQLRPVTLGRRNTQVTQVLSGLEDGEAVVVHPSDAIADGVRLIERSEL